MADTLSVSGVPKTKRAFMAALIVLFAAGLILGSFFLDPCMERWVATHQNPDAEIAAKLISRYGAWHWLMMGCAVCLATAWFRQRRDLIRILVAMMIATSIAGLSADILRGVTGRTRPNAPDAKQGWYGLRHDLHWLVGRHAYNAFPSGHTSAAVALAVTLLFSRRWLGALLLFGAASIAGSRIYLGDHHFSDVVGGVLLGAGVAAWVWFRAVEKVFH